MYVKLSYTTYASYLVVKHVLKRNWEKDNSPLIRVLLVSLRKACLGNQIGFFVCFFTYREAVRLETARIKAGNTLALAVPELATLGLSLLLLCFMCLGKYRKQSTLVLL